MFRRRDSTLEVLLVHPGGPFWAKKEKGAWSIPKGEHTDDEDRLEAAKREFQEETGITPAGDFANLGEAKQSAKIISAWAFEGDCDPSQIRSNTFSMEWPPKSGRQQEFPEIDRAAWFNLHEAEKRIVKGQTVFLHRLAAELNAKL
jgi:predicted NUDIX family NTP pyrophosphohydrolase